jgi:multidrug efflux system membrane fusion protein
MRAAGQRRFGIGARLVSLAIVALAITLGVFAFQHSKAHPATDDATIDAEVVHVAPAVGGRIVEIKVAENDRVTPGQLLFRIDPVPYQQAVAQARADLALARASRATHGRAIATQRSAATVAGDQIARAAANLALSQRTAARLRPLAEQGYVPRLQLDQAETAARDAATSMRQAVAQKQGATAAIDDNAASIATIQAREAALAIAEHALANTIVRAPHAGRVVGLAVLSGEMVAPTQSLFTLVNADTWFAVGNFLETELVRITPGDCATVYAMTDRRQAIRGTVTGIGAGVLDTDRVALPRALPYVQRSLNWVRVAQRFPVRVRLLAPPPTLMRLGASAVIQIRSGSACTR